MGARLGEQRGQNEKRKLQNVINKRKTRHSFAGGAVIEASLKKKQTNKQITSLILSEGHQL